MESEISGLPDLHAYMKAIVFNITQRDNGQPRAIQLHSLFASQQFATAIDQSESTYRLRELWLRNYGREERRTRD